MAATRTGSKRLLRDLNQNIVFNLIAEHGTISRTELAKQSRLPAATITRIVGDFIAAGLVSEGASEESCCGRRPLLLGINPSAGHVVGGNLREYRMPVTVWGLSCAPLFTSSQQIPRGATPHSVPRR